MTYLLTISAVNNKAFVQKSELDDVILWLSQNGVNILKRRYETCGRYNQLHFHASVDYTGYYSGLTRWGEHPYTYNTYSINFTPFKFHHYKYLNKQSDGNPILQDQILKEYYFRHIYNPHWTDVGG